MGLPLTVFDGSGQPIATNDGWPQALTTVFARVGAAPLATGSGDAAVLLTIASGAYGIALRGSGGATGEGLVEVYQVE